MNSINGNENVRKKYRIGLDLSYINYKELNGATYFSYNLLKGLHEIKQDNQAKRDFDIVVFCTKYVAEVVLRVCPEAKIVYTSSKIDELIGLVYDVARLAYREFAIPYIIKKEKLDVALFPHEMVSIFPHYRKMRTVYNLHDIACLSALPDRGKKKTLKARLFSAFIRFVYRRDLANADVIIAISRYDEEEILKFISADKVVQIYNPIDMEPCCIGAEKKEKVISALNLPYKHKNCITLVKAFERIKDIIPHKLIIMGNANPEAYEYAEAHNLLNRVVFTGFVSDDERNEVLKNCELYVSPTTFEGFGMTNAEAVLMGATTLLSDIKVNREVVGEAASYYSPVLDDKALAEKIIEILNNPDKKLTAEMQEKLYLKYSCKTIASQYLDVLLPDC